MSMRHHHRIRAWLPSTALFALLTAVGAVAAENEAAPATLYPLNGPPIEAKVQRVTLSRVYLQLGDGGGTSDRSYRDFSRIEYGKTSDVDYLKGHVDFGKGDFDKSYAEFMAAAKADRWQPLREESLLMAARAAAKVKKWDDAVAAVQQLETQYPESIHLPAAIALRGDAVLAKGDAAGAAAAYKKLVDNAPTWGGDAMALGVKGQASIARAAGKSDEAAAVIKRQLGTVVKPDTPGYGELSLQLAEDYLAAGKKAEALAVYEKAVYAPIDGADQAAAHLAAATLLAESASAMPELSAAFDHACLAVVLRGADAKTAAAGRKLARDLVAKMDLAAAKDPKAKELVDKEYRVYLQNL